MNEKQEVLKKQFVPDKMRLLQKGYIVIDEDEDVWVMSKKVRSNWLLFATILGLLFYLIPGILFGIFYAVYTKDDVKFVAKE